MSDRQSDTTSLNLVISPIVGVAIFYLIFVSILMISINSHRYKRSFVEKKYFTGSSPLLTPNLSSKTCGGPETLTSTTILKKCGGKASPGWQERYMLNTH